MWESVFDTVDTSVNFTITNALLAMAVSLALGFVLALVRSKIGGGRAATQNYVHTLVILPAVVTVIILLVGNSMARAFSLAGAFAIVRFRSAAADPRDITYVLFSMALGLCCGMGYLLFAAITAVVLCIVMIALELTHFGAGKRLRQLLRITIPENLSYNDAFDDILSKYTSSFERTRVKTTDLGSLITLQYLIVSKPGYDEKAFLDELRCRNGNLSISLTMAADAIDEY
jgi:hypothetical protein